MYKNKVISISAEIVAARRDGKKMTRSFGELASYSSHSVVIDQPVYEYLHQWTDLTNPAKGSKDQVKKMVCVSDNVVCTLYL